MKRFIALFAALLLVSAVPTSAKRFCIDPLAGDDQKSGLGESNAWRSFAPLEQVTLGPGDHVSILKPGRFDSTLCIKGAGSADAPIRVSFAAGRYDFLPDRMQERKLHISNTNDSPEEPKKLAIVLDGVKHVVLEGDSSDITCRGKMIEIFIANSEHVKLTGLNFDYHRPTVSEFKVLSRSEDKAVIEIHKDSTYRIEDGKLIWVGEGWSFPIGVGGGFQKRDTKRGQTFRFGGAVGKDVSARQVDGRKVELTGQNKLSEGDIFQNRQYRRDCVGVFQNLSRGITWEDCNLHFLHGMGVVSQFSEDITFRNVKIAPREGSGRTCAAWADMLHFSGCRGNIAVDNVLFSGANDDAINVHGTYLAIQKKISGKQVLVRFRHKQTYGFQPFYVGDEVGFVHRESLTTYGTNRVTQVERKDDREFVITFGQSVPASMEVNDVLENVTWTPSLKVTNCTVAHIPTRGFLISTPRKVEILNNHFIRMPMWPILIAGDCNSWFESGAVRDLVISNNRFIDCRPIKIHPENRQVDASAPVHKNIRIINNEFTSSRNSLLMVDAKSVQGLDVRNNTARLRGTPKTTDERELVRQVGCSDIHIGSNTFETVD